MIISHRHKFIFLKTVKTEKDKSGYGKFQRSVETLINQGIPVMWCVINWYKKLLRPTRAGTANSNACLLKPVPNAKLDKKH